MAALRVDARSSRWRRITMLLAISIASFLVVFDDSAVSVALPSLQRDLQLDMNELEWTLNSYTLGLATVLLLAGQLVDRFGPRRALITGLTLFAAASVPSALAGSGGVLIAARAVQGMGAGFLAPAGLAVISALFPASRRAFAVGIWAGISAIGLGSGPLLGAIIVRYFGWSGLFLINVPLGLILIAASLSTESVTPAKRARGRMDFMGATTAAGALLLVLLMLTRGNPDGWLSLPVVALGAGALASAAAFLTIETRASNPVVPLEAFRSRHLIGAVVLGLLSTAAMCSLFFFVSLYLQSVAGYDVLAAGAAFLPMTAVIAVGSPLAGLAGNRITPRTLAAGGMMLLTLAMLGLSRLDNGLGVVGIVLGLTLAGAGVAMTATPVTTIALAELPASRQGLAGALVSTARTVGLAVGVAVMGAILGDARGADLTSRLSLGLELNAGVAAMGVLAAIWLLRPAGQRHSRQAQALTPEPSEAKGRA